MRLSDLAEIWDEVMGFATGRQTETLDFAPEVQRPYGMPTGPYVPDIPVSEQEAAETAGWSSPSASRVCQSTTEDYRRTYAKPLLPRSIAPVYLGIVIAFLVMVVGCGLDNSTKTVTPEAAQAQATETPGAPQITSELNSLRAKAQEISITATANGIANDETSRAIAMMLAEVNSQISMMQAEQDMALKAEQVARDVEATKTAIPPQQTGTALALQGTQSAQTPTAVANAALISDAQSRASREQAERWSAPAKAMTADVIVPLVIVFGIVFTALAIAVPVGRAWAYSIELYAERTAPPPAHVYQYDDPIPSTPCANGNGTHGARTGDEFVEIDLEYARSMLAGRPVGEKLPGVNTVPGKEYDNMLKLMDGCGVVEVRPNVGTFYRGDNALYTALRMLGQGRAPSLVKDFIEQDGKGE